MGGARARGQLLQPWLGVDAIWWSFPVSSVCAMLMSLAYYRWGCRRQAHMLSQPSEDEETVATPAEVAGTPPCPGLCAASTFAPKHHPPLRTPPEIRAQQRVQEPQCGFRLQALSCSISAPSPFRRARAVALLLVLSLLALCTALLPASARAQIQLKMGGAASAAVVSDTVTTPRVQAQLVALAPQGIAPGQPLKLGCASSTSLTGTPTGRTRATPACPRSWTGNCPRHAGCRD